MKTLKIDINSFLNLLYFRTSQENFHAFTFKIGKKEKNSFL